MDYARKLIEAGVYTELHVEPGVPHAYDAFEGTPQTNLLEQLRDNAIARMFGKHDYEGPSEEDIKLAENLKQLLGL